MLSLFSVSPKQHHSFCCYLHYRTMLWAASPIVIDLISLFALITEEIETCTSVAQMFEIHHSQYLIGHGIPEYKMQIVM